MLLNFMKMKKLQQLDCSSLAKKIKNKEKDFYYPVIHSVDREINVWLNISSQYQKCKE